MELLRISKAFNTTIVCACLACDFGVRIAHVHRSRMPVREYLRECFGLCVKFSHGQRPIMHDMNSVCRERRMYTNVPDCTFSMHDQKNARSVHGDKQGERGQPRSPCL